MIFEEKYTPEYKDHCGHTEGSYIGSFKDCRDKWYDIYVYDTRLNDESQDVCIRYGNEGHEYISPGSLLTVIQCRNSDIYDNALEIILKKGKISFVLNRD